MSTQSELKNLLKDLIAIPSVSPTIRPKQFPEGEAAVCRRLQEFFADRNIPSETVDVTPGRPNLYVRLDFGCPQTVILSAHTDTVPVDDWQEDPFMPREDGNIIFGRGSCDTKASVAAFAWATSLLAQMNDAKCNVIFAAVCDEEAGFGGSKFAARQLEADFAIAGEPTGLQVYNRHKGVTRFVVSASGKSCHSSSPDKGVNAIYPLAKAVLVLKEKAREWKEVRQPDFGERTMSVTTIVGGQAPNIVPDSCQADVDVRSLPGDMTDNLLQELREVLDSDVMIAAAHMSGPPLQTPEDHPLVQAMVDITGQPAGQALYATDAAQYSVAGIPAVVFGPGDISYAHTREEQVDFREVEQCAEILVKFLRG